MSQLIKRIKAQEEKRYLFTIALDHAPEQGEMENIEAQIQGAMETLGVPAEQIGVTVLKSVAPEGADMRQDEAEQTIWGETSRYLLCVLIRTEEGGFTEEPASVAERAVRAFAKFANLPAENIAAVVLEDAYLEVDVQIMPQTARVSQYAQLSFGRR